MLPKCCAFLLFILSLLASIPTYALDVPLLTGPVVDSAKLLSAQEQQTLSTLLHRFHSLGGPQVQFLIIESLEGESIENYSIKVTDQWKLGNKEKDDGVLFTMSLKEREMRIEVGQGLEGQLTDVRSAHIIREVRDYFRQRAFFDGLVFIAAEIAQATDSYALFEQAAGQVDGQQVSTVRKKSMRTSPFLIVLIIILFFVIKILSWFSAPVFEARGRYSQRWSGGHNDHWGGGFGGGGGSWGGGGGGFSGGGSSGKW